MYFSNTVISEFKAGFERKNQPIYERWEIAMTQFGIPLDIFVGQLPSIAV